MPPRQDRFYRYRHRTAGSVAFQVQYRETDLWIRAEKHLEREARDAILTCRRQLEDYLARVPEFVRSLQPLPRDPLAPRIVRRMLEAGELASVGPMAAVAGAIAQWVAEALKPLTPTVIVENGGDCYLDVAEPIQVGLYAGPRSPFSNRLALRFDAERFPLAICTSSATIGHSLSLGKADAVTVISPDAALADAAATALGNLVKKPSDIAQALERAGTIAGVSGVLILIEDQMGAWGEMELAPL